jgi:Holliday junction resolvasome RuvABC endonuclease subunit
VKRWCIGIDPGLRETGAVLFLDEGEETPVAWSTWSCASTEFEDIQRVVALASRVIDEILFWIAEYGIEKLDISIETPVYKRNAATFTKQVRLVQEIESGIFHIVAGELAECWVTEINPISSKVLSTGRGRATKEEMIAVSPFTNSKARKHTVETLADAWSHGLAAWTKGNRLRYSTMRVAEVIEHVRHTGETPSR